MRKQTVIPRIVVAGTASGVGKTTVAATLMAAFTAAGERVQPYKVGPDYIDPGYHRAVTGRISRNLDSHLISSEAVTEIFAHAAQDADIAVIEGVMGLFDGAVGGGGSTADLAKLIGAPVVLVLGCAGAGQSIAAVAAGFKSLDHDLSFAGVILNQVSSARHLEILKSALDGIGIPVLGWLYRSEGLGLKERHLGLIPYGEDSESASVVDRLLSVNTYELDMETIKKIAADVPPLFYEEKLYKDVPSKHVRLGVARDKAFNFYYQDNFDILTTFGAEIIEFSPLADDRLPADIDGLYLGGGFPEVFAAELADNQPMRQAVGKAIDAGLPTYAECGGLIYLTKGLSIDGAAEQPMCGVIDVGASFTPGLKSLGYRRAQAVSDNLLTAEGGIVRGHEFHYCELSKVDTLQRRAYAINKPTGEVWYEGFARGDLLASFIHVHFGSDPGQAERFVSRASVKAREAVKS